MRVYILWLFLILSGCSKSSSTVVVRTAGKPIPVDDVTVMMEYPLNYSTVEILDCEKSDWSMKSTNAARQVCIEDMRYRAAGLGANGLVLIFADDESDGGPVPVRNPMDYAENSRAKLSGVAIFYLK